MNNTIKIGSLVEISTSPGHEGAQEKIGLVLQSENSWHRVWFCFSEFEFEPRWISSSEINLLTKKTI